MYKKESNYELSEEVKVGNNDTVKSKATLPLLHYNFHCQVTWQNVQTFTDWCQNQSLEANDSTQNFYSIATGW